jgi:carboxypeptidase C (cathepsin A)
MRNFAVLVLLSIVCLTAVGQERGAERRGAMPAEHPAEARDDGQPPKPPVAEKEAPEEKPVVTHHQMTVGGKPLHYTATVGMMPIKNEQTNKVEAHMFYVAYALDNPPAGRPLTFAFNGGPGSSSVWLHMGAIGPKRVKMLPEGGMPAPPFQIEDNQYTWLDATDLVFIDPVGTGYSRALTPELGKKFWGLQGDIASVGEFIRMYLTRSKRWTSPLFLAGESYGTTRAAGLSGYLIDRGIPLNGITLISSVLHFETLSFARGNDLPYIAYLPTYAMTAQYHKRLPPDVQQMDGAKLLAEVMQWANTGYTEALQKGDRLSADERRAVIERLSRYTGLSHSILDEHDLRIDQPTFSRELLRDRKLQVGRLDSRFLGPASPEMGPYGYDPSEAAIRPPFTTVLNEYIRSELGYQTDLIYYILGGGIGAQWDMGTGTRGGFPETAEALRRAFVKNPYMRVLVAEGWYDVATPILGIEYTLSHMGLDASMRKNISTAQYPAGHMVYIQVTSLAKMKKDVVEMMQQALKGGGNDLSPAK